MDADVFAEKAHAGQKRKFTDEPYIEHPRRVCERVRQWGMDDPDVLAAAVLHDVVEDCAVGLNEIIKEFGATTAIIVRTLTKDDTFPKNEQRIRAIEQLRNGPDEAVIVKLADRIDNILDYPQVEKLGWDYFAEAAEIRAIARARMAEWNSKTNSDLRTPEENRVYDALDRGSNELGMVIFTKLRQKGGWL